MHSTLNRACQKKLLTLCLMKSMPNHTLHSQRLFQLTALVALLVVACSPGSRIARKQPIERTATIGSPQFENAIVNIVNEPWLEKKHITTLINGDAFFPAMLGSIRSAKKTITFETYAFINGTMAQTFTNAFCERARHGVKVHLILDSIGSIDIGEENVKRLRDAGVKLTFYHPYAIFNPLRYNTRDHRKLMVVDGKTGFTGGCGVADAWSGNAETIKNWRENHYQVTGPAVAQIQRAFHANWRQTGGAPLTGPDYFPKLTPTGYHKAQVFISSPKDKLYTIPHLYRQVIASAQKTIIIENSYFVPDHSILKEILAARNRGVHVEIIVPGINTDSWPVRILTRNSYRKLLRAGVHIYEYQATMMHCKVMVVDGLFSSVGSANFDPRSLYINDESNLNVLDRRFAQEQLRCIEIDKKNSLRITAPPSPWNPLTLPQRLAAQSLAPQL